MDNSINETQKNEMELREEIMNRIYIQMNYIFEFYSTNDLNQVMTFTNFNVDKMFFFLENYTKEDLFKRIEEHQFLFNKSKKPNINQIQPLSQKIIKEKHYIMSKYLLSREKNNNNISEIAIKASAWNFLNSGSNIIDLKDAIKSFDKMKIINKIKKQHANNNSNNNHSNSNDIAFNREFIKKLEQKERKYISLYQNCLEEADINYLQQTDHFNSIPLKKNQITVNIKDSIRLIPNLLSVPLSLFNFIFSYLDIFTIGKVGLCSKELYNLIYKHYAFNMFTARCYTNSIFLNSHLYQLNLPLLKKQFKSNYDMFKGKNRIRYGGLYYCKVKYIKEVQIYGEEFNKNVLVQYYRVLRFLPNGEVHMMTTPYFKVNKIKNGIKNGSIELKVGTFRVDENEQIILNIGESDEYIYKFGWNDIRRYRAGYSKGDIGVIRGFELVKYNIIRGNQRTEIIINDKFPIAFRFRPIEKLINELGFVCIKEEEDEAIR